jgi:hypothetical protein
VAVLDATIILLVMVELEVAATAQTQAEAQHLEPLIQAVAVVGALLPLIMAAQAAQAS